MPYAIRIHERCPNCGEDLAKWDPPADSALADPAPRVVDECVGCLAESDEPHRPGCRYEPADLTP